MGKAASVAAETAPRQGGGPLFTELKHFEKIRHQVSYVSEQQTRNPIFQTQKEQKG